MLRWLRLQNAVTYDRVSSFFAGLPPCLAAFSSLCQSVDFVSILKGCPAISLRDSPDLYYVVYAFLAA